MNVDFYVYNTSTGAILFTGICPQSMVAVQAFQAGTAAGQGAVDPDVDTINITTGLPNPPPGTDVPVSTVNLSFSANGVAEGLINGMLNGTKAVWFDGITTVIDNGELRVTSDYASTFPVTLVLPGYDSVPLTFTAT